MHRPPSSRLGPSASSSPPTANRLAATGVGARRPGGGRGGAMRDGLGGDLLQRAVSRAVKLVRQLAQILDQPVALARELLDVSAHLGAVAIRLLPQPARLLARLRDDPLRL